MYAHTNYKTKKALIEDVKAGKEVTVFQPGPFPGSTNGRVCIEGPHYPEAHRWYAEATIEDCIVIKVR